MQFFLVNSFFWALVTDILLLLVGLHIIYIKTHTGFSHQKGTKGAQGSKDTDIIFFLDILLEMSWKGSSVALVHAFDQVQNAKSISHPKFMCKTAIAPKGFFITVMKNLTLQNVTKYFILTSKWDYPSLIAHFFTCFTHKKHCKWIFQSNLLFRKIAIVWCRLFYFIFQVKI